MDKYLTVRESLLPGAGKGLFTTAFIPKGTRITEYKGRRTTWADVEDDSDNGYIFHIDDENVIDAGSNKKSVARYANDAHGLSRVRGLSNNSEYVNDDNRIYIVAKRDIDAGSEIFVSYGKGYWDTVRENLRIDREQSKKK